MNHDCIFCKIVRKEIKTDKIIYENEDFIAFLDINPYAIGHTLVMPKKHSKWVWDMNESDYEKLMKEVKKLAEVLRRVFDTEWIEEIIAGIGVQHTHIHLLPRKRNDGLGEIPVKPLDPKPSEEKMREIVEKIRQFF